MTLYRLLFDTEDAGAGAKVDEMTPFMQFWDAINRLRVEKNLPEIMYGEAVRLWELVAP